MSEVANPGFVGTCSRSWSFPELGAEVRSDCTPGDLATYLSGRYGSPFCTPEYFDLYDQPPNYNVCLLEDPPHAILFSVSGATADVLNRLIDIDPESLERVAAAVFRAHPAVKRIRAEVKFPPAELRSSHRVVQRADDMVVRLPQDADGYHALIGKTTRKHLRQYSNQLRRRYPDFELRSFEREEISLDLMERVVGWTSERLRAKGGVSVYEEAPEKVQPVWLLLQRYGLGLCGYIGGECVAAQLILCVGDDTWIHTVGFDSRFEDVHLGLLMTYFSILESIERGFGRTHMLFGTRIYKQRLGAVPVTAYQVSVYRSSLHKGLYAREAWEILLRDRNEIYWAARHAVKRRIHAAVGLARRLVGGGTPAPADVSPSATPHAAVAGPASPADQPAPPAGGRRAPRP